MGAPARLPVGFDTDVNAPAVAEFEAVQRELEALDGTERNSSAGAFVRALFEDATATTRRRRSQTTKLQTPRRDERDG